MNFDSYLLMLIAAVVGVLSSLIGVGGGILLVPIFTLLFSIPIKQALALSLCSVMATSLTASSNYLNSGLVDLKTALYLEITTLMFAYLGGRAVGWISGQVIAFIFAAVLVASVYAMFKPSKDRPVQQSPPKKSYPLLIAASTLARGMVGVLGIGGGIVMVPILRLTANKSMKEAVATSTFMLGTSAAVALIPFISRGDISYDLAPFTVLGTIVGSYFGSKLFHKIESKYITIIFGALMLYTAYSMVMKGLGK